MMDNLQKIITERRAVFPRQYNTQPLSKETIQKVLASANWAPTHKHTEPWRFKVVYGEEKLEEFARFLGAAYKATTARFVQGKYERIMDKVCRSSCILLICFQRDPRARIPEWEEIAAMAMAVQNMWLTAASMGVGAYWSSSGLRHEVGQYVKLQEGERCMGFFYMGNYDGQLPKGKRGALTDRVDWL